MDSCRSLWWLSVLISGIVALVLADDLVASEQTLELADLLREGLARNPEIQAARKQWEAAQERIPQARALPDPAASVHFWNFPYRGAVPDVGRADNTIIGLGQRFPFPGKLALQGAVAGHAADVREQAVRAKEREVVAQLKQAYFHLFLAYKDVELHHEQIELLKQLFEVANAAFRTGKGSQVDVLKAQVELSQLYQRLPVLEQRRVTLIAQLNALLDRDPKTVLGVPREPSTTGVGKSVEELEHLALGTRPELLAAERTIQQNQAARTFAEKLYYPDFDVRLERFQNFQAPDGFGAYGLMTIPFSFWTKPKYDAGVREAHAAEASARATYQTWVNATRWQLTDLVAKIQAQYEVLGLYQTTILPQAQQTLKAAQAGYRTGRNDFFDVIDAERSLLDFRLAYYRALVERESHVATLEQVVGAGL